MSFSIDVDTSQLDNALESIVEALSTIGEPIHAYLDNSILPELEARAASERKVRTGTYASTWEAIQDGPTSALIQTEAYYWWFLEEGTRYIAGKPVVMPTLEDSVQELKQVLIDAVNGSYTT